MHSEQSHDRWFWKIQTGIYRQTNAVSLLKLEVCQEEKCLQTDYSQSVPLYHF